MSGYKCFPLNYVKNDQLFLQVQPKSFHFELNANNLKADVALIKMSVTWVNESIPTVKTPKYSMDTSK